MPSNIEPNADLRSTAARRKCHPTLAAALIALIALASALPGSVPPASAEVSAGGITSDNLQWLRQEPTGGWAVGGRKVGQYFYVTDFRRGLLIYDISQPETPRLVGEIFLPFFGENEDVATNGRIALVSQGSLADLLADGTSAPQESVLNVIDVSDKHHPTLLASVPGAGAHTYECILDCAWAYGSKPAHIVDLRDPANPKLSEHRWDQAPSVPETNKGTAAHDVTEVSPGRVLTASRPVDLFLDARHDPEKPRLLATSDPKATPSMHNLVWPNRGQDHFIIGVDENVPPGHMRCETRQQVEHQEDVSSLAGRLTTWRASDWPRTRLFTPIANWAPDNGSYVDGDPTVSTGGVGLNGGCGTHWVDPHPEFRNGGLVAEAAWGHGVKLLSVDTDGGMTEIGHYLPHAGDSVSVYWITGRILYAIDAERGIDVLRFAG